MSLARHERRDGVGRLWFTRPEKRNALSHAMVDEVLAAVDDFVAAGVTVAVLEAEGPVFCAGADVTEALADTANPASERLLARLMHDPLFWVAAVRGPAFGAGVAVAAVCPVVVCASSARFELPEHRLGLFPSGAMTYIEAAVGPRRAVELGVTGRAMSAAEAASCGLVNEVSVDGEVDAAVGRWVDVLARDPLVARNAGRSWRSVFASKAFAARKAELDGFLELPAQRASGAGGP